MDDDPEDGIEIDDLEAKETDTLNDEHPITHDGPLRSRPIAYLDGLRGLAAFLVYMSHHIVFFYGSDSPIQSGFGWQGHRVFGTLPFIRIFFTGGHAAVAIFFVLSGYVLSRSPLRKLRDGQLQRCYHGLLSASIRRPFRLYTPAIGVSLCVAILLHLPFGLAPRLTYPETQTSFAAEMRNWLVELVLVLNPFTRHAISTHWFPYDPPVWTMPVELQGSILVFALIALSSRLKPRSRILSISVLSLTLLIFAQWSMACFLAGMILAAIDIEHRDPNLSKRTRTIIHNSVFIAGWWLLCQTSGTFYNDEASSNTWGWYWPTLVVPSTYSHGAWWRFWTSVGAVLLVWSVLRLRWLQKLLTISPMRYLGRISFSLYLTHIPFLWFVGDTVYRLMGTITTAPERQIWADNLFPIPDVGPLGLSTRFLAAQLLILPLNILVSEVGTVLLDQPSIAMGRWVAARFGIDRRDVSVSPV